MSQQTLTSITTACIVLSGAALLVGWRYIRAGRRVLAHRNAMLVAVTMAAAFLVLYVTRAVLYEPKAFAGPDWMRSLYRGVLFPHMLLAAVLPVLVVRLLWLALAKRDYAAHRKLGRITLPLWLVVAGSGWFIYWMLYHAA